ncbi:Zinc finger CCCH domain-containing protein 20 [Linum perenne]
MSLSTPSSPAANGSVPCSALLLVNWSVLPSLWDGGLPTTPTGLGYSELWDEPEMERVESGRDIRAKMLQKLSEENMPERVDPVPDPSADVDDFGWVSELVQ